jgi:hypothetical protein
MDRRTFAKLAAAGLARPASAGQMKLGTQNDSSDAALRVLAALGVRRSSTRTGPWRA